VTMAEWSDKLDTFLKQNEEELLTHAGSVKAEVAKMIAEERYEAFDKKRKITEAKKADEEDLKELEEMEKRLLNKKDGKDR
ncbi:MAG: RhuM family protein, partial [Candidatus Marinimicrobia bacterium]|nr:RhuM family protein [Candidatus Neomarinimicrobiota bacterium]